MYKKYYSFFPYFFIYIYSYIFYNNVIFGLKKFYEYMCYKSTNIDLPVSGLFRLVLFL